MNYQEVFNTYQELKNILKGKKDAILKKDLETLSKIDEQSVALCEKIAKFDLKNTPNDFSDEQKQELKKLGLEIKQIEENNEILIKHSLDVINNILSGILNITANEQKSYDSKGRGCQNTQSLDISSITEEA